MGFSQSGIVPRLLAFVFWWLTAVGATVVVACDHGPLLDAIELLRP